MEQVLKSDFLALAIFFGIIISITALAIVFIFVFQQPIEHFRIAICITPSIMTVFRIHSKLRFSTMMFYGFNHLD